MIAVFIRKGNDWVMVGNAHADTPGMRNQMKNEATYFIDMMRIEAKVFRKA